MTTRSPQPDQRARPNGPVNGGSRPTPPESIETPRTIEPEELPPPDSTTQLTQLWSERAGELREKFAYFISILLEANQHFNLTADRDPLEQWQRHIEDTLHNALLLERNYGMPGPGTRLLDVGSGAGVPGLLWAIIWPDARVDLLEATEKRAHFLETAACRLGLSHVGIINARAEVAGHNPDHRQCYDWVTARGLAVLPTLAEWTMPFAKVGGMVLAIKGAGIEEERRSANRAFRLLGAPDLPKTYPYTRADGKSCTLLAYRKASWTPSPYPRRVGVASKNSL